MNPRKFKIFIHVPKTAGTAVARLIEEAYPDQIFYDYGTERNLKEARTPQPLVLYNRDSIPIHYQMIYGHFHYLKYAELYYQAEFLSMVRNPLDRAVSHYYHLARYQDPLPHPVAEKVKSGQWDILDMHRNNPGLLRGVYSMYFEGRSVRDFAYILVQERLFESLLGCSRRLDMPELHEVLQHHGRIPMVNSKPEAPPTSGAAPVTEDQLGVLSEMLAAELKIYHEVVEAFAE